MKYFDCTSTYFLTTTSYFNSTALGRFQGDEFEELSCSTLPFSFSCYFSSSDLYRNTDILDWGWLAHSRDGQMEYSLLSWQVINQLLKNLFYDLLMLQPYCSKIIWACFLCHSQILLLPASSPLDIIHCQMPHEKLLAPTCLPRPLACSSRKHPKDGSHI